MHFARSGFDFADETTNPVTNYLVLRRVDEEVVDGVRTDLPPGNWDLVASIPAAQQDIYQVTIATAQDSVVSVYFVMTQTEDPLVHYFSPPDSASSFDDLAPAIPSGLQLVTPELLAWDDPIDEDFAYFSVYGSPLPEIGAAVLIDQTVEPQLAVPGSGHDYFLVTATDEAGNESAAAILAVHETASPDGPSPKLALGPFMPNPFNPSTTISFVVPVDGRVRLQVIDLGGRTVATLVDWVLPKGRHNVAWDGRNAAGHEVPSGVYLSRLEASGQVAHGRMTLVR